MFHSVYNISQAVRFNLQIILKIFIKILFVLSLSKRNIEIKTLKSIYYEILINFIYEQNMLKYI